MGFKQDIKRNQERSKDTIKCKCGCSTVITNKTDRCICRWCGKWLYRTPAIEFEYILKEKMKKAKTYEK